MAKQYMNQQECYSAGFDWGWSIATWNNMPEPGSELPKEIDWIGIEIVDSVESQIEAWELILQSAEESARCYSPFECTAHAINSRDEYLGECAAESGWDAFERGTRAAWSKYRRQTYPMRELRRDWREWESEQESD